jgi:hypothetical protein
MRATTQAVLPHFRANRSGIIATAFAQDPTEAATIQWRKNVGDQIRPKVPEPATLMDSAEQGVLAYMTFLRPAGPSCTRPTLSSD